MLDALEARVGGLGGGQMVVLDRGMAFDDNLEQLRARGLHYLVAGRQGERTRWLAEFENLEGSDEVIHVPSPRNPRQKKTKVEVKLKRTEDETGSVRRFVLGPFCQTLTNLSPKMTANCVLALNHSRGGRVHASAA